MPLSVGSVWISSTSPPIWNKSCLLWGKKEGKQSHRTGKHDYSQGLKLQETAESGILRKDTKEKDPANSGACVPGQSNPLPPTPGRISTPIYELLHSLNMCWVPDTGMQWWANTDKAPCSWGLHSSFGSPSPSLIHNPDWGQTTGDKYGAVWRAPSRVRLPAPPLTTVGSWASNSLLCLSLHPCKMGIIVIATLGLCESSTA